MNAVEYFGIRGAQVLLLLGRWSGVYSCTSVMIESVMRAAFFGAQYPKTGTLVSLIMVVFSMYFTTTGDPVLVLE